jgi:hypothetical protein
MVATYFPKGGFYRTISASERLEAFGFASGDQGRFHTFEGAPHVPQAPWPVPFRPKGGPTDRL